MHAVPGAIEKDELWSRAVVVLLHVVAYGANIGSDYGLAV